MQRLFQRCVFFCTTFCTTFLKIFFSYQPNLETGLFYKFQKLSSSLLLLSLQIKHKCVILTLENLKEYERIITAWG
jgi:hypothetical protein